MAEFGGLRAGNGLSGSGYGAQLTHQAGLGTVWAQSGTTMKAV